MNLAPPITSEGLRLLPFGTSFLTSRYIGWLNDRDVVRFSENRHRHHTRESCEAYFQDLCRDGNFFWAIVLDSGNHIGNIVAYHDKPNGVSDLSIMIGDRAVWGRGLGKRAWRAACDYLLGDGGVRKVTAGTMSINLPMLSVMRATGMVEEGRRAAQFLFEGKEIDLVLAARFRNRTPNS